MFSFKYFAPVWGFGKIENRLTEETAPTWCFKVIQSRTAFRYESRYMGDSNKLNFIPSESSYIVTTV